jgi:hypothetical protein
LVAGGFAKSFWRDPLTLTNKNRPAETPAGGFRWVVMR